MPTNEERSEVAARLRELEIHCWYDGMDEVDSLETAIGCAIGQDWQDQDWWERLADLIEPEPEYTCKNVTKHYAYGFKCSLCDFEQYDGDTLISFDYEYCPNCGAKVVE